jgi:hypothetical protein
VVKTEKEKKRRWRRRWRVKGGKAKHDAWEK